MGISGVNSAEGTLTGVKVVNGIANIPLYAEVNNSGKAIAYTGSETVEIILGWSGFAQFNEFSDSYYYLVQFTNGVGTIDFNANIPQ
jgi:hypothetical protein